MLHDYSWFILSDGVNLEQSLFIVDQVKDQLLSDTGVKFFFRLNKINMSTQLSSSLVIF